MNLKKSLMTLTLLLPMVAFGGVNLKNGNFYITYTDIIVPGGDHDLEVTRTYNSKSTDNGWFGFGWGSLYETKLMVSADGSVVVMENGSGAQTRFIPKESINVESASKKIVEAMKKKEPMSDVAVQSLLKRLNNDAELRQFYSKKYNVETKLADGTILYSNDRGIQTISKEKTGYKRTNSDGKTDYFDNDGKLSKISDKNGYSILFEYKGEVLTSIKDTQAKQILLDWYPDGKIKGASYSGEKKTSYAYDTKGNLTTSTDVLGNVYKYDYDANHNLTQINYADASKMQVKYDKNSFATEVVERNGESTKYKYENNPKNPDFHYWTTVTKKTLDAPETNSRYEYEIKTKPDGQQYTYRIATEVDGIKTETIYSECCSLPLKITRGKDVTTFEYNAKGLLTKKTSTRGEYVELAYDDKINKITKVVNNDGWTTFQYDKIGNLAKAINSSGKSVLLIYDRLGKITKMIDQEKDDAKSRRTLSFKYNSLGKPVEIEMENVGIINVAYDNYGEIKKVESKAGAKMALQVTQAFQSLLSIVKPAGVNLNM
ncbi:MAG: RHS repeat protein [Rhizobacter sp.]|nr:RHS repeat protein [Bacteriovorax sp.]